MKFEITVCTRIWTDEEPGYGEPSSSESEDLEPTTFKDLINYLRNYSIDDDSASCYPVLPGDRFWITVLPDADILTGSQAEITFHLKAKDERSLRYWYKAFKAASV